MLEAALPHLKELALGGTAVGTGLNAPRGFAELAMQESSDGSKYVGGLYTGVYEGQMVTAFNDWCFDSSRKPGDTDVVETEYGAHVMYFVNRNLPYWQMDVVTDLRDAAYNEWLSNLSADCSITRHDSGMKFVG